MTGTSRDGFHWTKKSQTLQQGIPSIGVIQPPSNLSASDAEKQFDVIVIGAGYTGLTATRDSAVAGKRSLIRNFSLLLQCKPITNAFFLQSTGLKVLTLEGRDRIGGRSWSSNIDGYPFEMGGTWVHWGQAQVWRELMRYGMSEDLEESADYSRGVNKFTMDSAGGVKSFSHAEEDALVEAALKKFVDVDGTGGRTIMPNPYAQPGSYTAAAMATDKFSASDRLAQIASGITPDERTALESFILLCSGGTLETMSFFEFLRWWALSGYTYEGCINHLIRFKFKGGQSSFAINFWREAISTGNLKYAFNSPIASVVDNSQTGLVTVTTRAGQSYTASCIICTVPLNVLNNVSFTPPLPKVKTTASSIGHVNQCVKVHAETPDRDLRSWSGMKASSAPLLYAIGDGTTPTGNTHIVAFGASQSKHLEPEEDIATTHKAMTDLVDMDIHRLVFHNWSKDEFAKGAWFFPDKGFLTLYLEGLRAGHGRVHFANSDWALGWRSFIDGAIEEGTRAALAVKKALLTGQAKL